MGVKGSWFRPHDDKKYSDEYDRIFGKKKLNNIEEKGKNDDTGTTDKPQSTGEG